MSPGWSRACATANPQGAPPAEAPHESLVATAGLTRDAREALLRHDWPGNVRELRNALERAAILCEGGLINAHHMSLRPANKPSGTATTDLSALERETIAQVLRECRWNKSKAARRLGLSRTQLYVRMRKYGLEPSASV